MNIVKITNQVALTLVVILMYWVFIFICSTVFGFKVFQKNMSDLFMLSILGIFAILFGAIILNIMLNLTAIAAGNRQSAASADEAKPSTQKNKPWLITFYGSFVLIFTLLYAGDWATSQKKESYLVSSVADLVEEQQPIINTLADYSFTRQYIKIAHQNIRILSRIEEKFPKITVITLDKLAGKTLLLGFTRYSRLDDDEEALKADYIFSASSEERSYLQSVFAGEITAHRFSSHNGRYEVYYPVKTDKGQIVIHLTQQTKYGKIGS